MLSANIYTFDATVSGMPLISIERGQVPEHFLKVYHKDTISWILTL